MDFDTQTLAMVGRTDAGRGYAEPARATEPLSGVAREVLGLALELRDQLGLLDSKLFAGPPRDRVDAKGNMPSADPPLELTLRMAREMLGNCVQQAGGILSRQ